MIAPENPMASADKKSSIPSPNQNICFRQYD
jgi:hypothetical protein